MKDIEAGGGTDYVLLCKDNKSPFIKITKGIPECFGGSYSDILREGNEKISEAEQRDQQRMAVSVKSLDEKIRLYNEGLKNNKEKYKDRPEELARSKPQPSLIDLANRMDVFTGQYLSDPESASRTLPVYKVAPIIAALCKEDKSQWVVVSWYWDPHDLVEKYMHESIINNFNFEYVNNFFFDPAKVKGQPYKPLRSPTFKEAVVVTEASEASKKNN